MKISNADLDATQTKEKLFVAALLGLSHRLMTEAEVEEVPHLTYFLVLMTAVAKCRDISHIQHRSPRSRHGILPPSCHSRPI